MDNKYRKVAIIGVKDKKGCYYACNSFLKDYGPKLTQINSDIFIPTLIVEVYPYTTFSSFSSYDPSIYEKVILEVEVEMTEEEYSNLSTGWIGYYQFKGREVKLIREIELPWAYALNLYDEVIEERTSEGIRYQLTTWQSRLHFKNDEEFAHFIRIWNKDSFEITKSNLNYLPEILKHPVERISLSDFLHGVTGQRGSLLDLNELIAKVDKSSLVNYAYGASYACLETLDESLMDKEFFEMLIERDIRGGERDYQFFLNYMPEKTVKEYGADELFEKCYSQIYYLKLENEAEYQLDLENSTCRHDFEDYEDYDYEDYDYSEYLNPCSEGCEDCIYGGEQDERDKEIERLYRLFPDLTPKSIPLLQTLSLTKFEQLLSPMVRQSIHSNTIDSFVG